MRTFIAIELPQDVKDFIQGSQATVRDALSKCNCAYCFRWTAMTNVHLTLRFLGETTEHQQSLLAAGLDRVAREWSPFTLRINGLGGFPTIQRPRVLWMGIAGDMDGLHKVQGHVERIVQEAGFEPESRPYSPHLTVARTKRDCSRRDVQQAGILLDQLAEAEGKRSGANVFPVEQIVHMRSELGRSGAVYSVLSTHTLRG